MKVAVLGGASFSTPALFRDMNGDFAGCEFALAGRSARHLQAVGRAARELAGANAPTVSTVVCDAETSGPALADADVVLIQMRIGNMPGRGFDESFPLRFDLCGDEGLGAGGLSAAWRSWPVIETWLEAIVKHAPRAIVLMMSSPVGILTRAARTRFPRLQCFGICEVPYIALRDISTLLEVDPSSIRFEYLGVNHIGWLYAVHEGGRDLASEWADHPSRHGFPEPEIVQLWGGIPTKYLRLHFDPAAVVASQKSAAVPRAEQLESLQRSAFEEYLTASTAGLRELLDRRETPWYSDSIIPLLRGLHAGQSHVPLFLSGPNLDHRAEFAPDDILEIACRVEGGTLSRIPSSTAPPARIAGMIHDFCEHERRATEAVMVRNKSLVREALEGHPWIARAAQPPELVSRLADVIVLGNIELEKGQLPAPSTN